jgi:hypothetical protein
MPDTGHRAAELRLAAEHCSELADQLEANRNMLKNMAKELRALADGMDAKKDSGSGRINHRLWWVLIRGREQKSFPS